MNPPRYVSTRIVARGDALGQAPGEDGRHSADTLFCVRASHSEPLLYYLQIAGQEHAGAECGAGIASGIVVAEIAETDQVGGSVIADRVDGGIVLKLFGFGYGILRPTQVDASEIGLLGGKSDGSFFGLVVNLHLGFGIDFRRHRSEIQRIDIHGGEEGGSFYYSIPDERIDHVGIGGNSERVDSLVIARLEGG